MNIDINAIRVNYEWTDDIATAKKWLNELETKEYFAADFEAAIRYTADELDFVKRISEDPNETYIERKRAAALLASTPLDHPAHSLPTHLSVAWSDRDAYVFVISSDEMLELLLVYLVTTRVKQVWHNASYDFKHIYYHTGRMPIDYEDTQIFTKSLLNHVDTVKAKSGLKEIAGHMYGDWGISSDNFTREQMYDPKVLKYAAIDSCATFWIYERLAKATSSDMEFIRSTADDYSPMDQLPMESPKGAIYPEAFFYHNTAKFLVRDTVRLMMNGLPISLEKVHELENTLSDILEKVTERLANNPMVRRFLSAKAEYVREQYVAIQKNKLKSAEDFIVSFDPANQTHRSYFMYLFAERVGIVPPTDLLPTGIPKWSANAVKKLTKAYPPLLALAKKELTDKNPTAAKAMGLLAQHKADIYNSKYLKKIESPDLPDLEFNPNSSLMKQEIFAFYDIDSDTTSAKTGNSSWNREEIERVNKTTEDEDIREFTQTLIDHSFAAIVKNNFINSFYRYTVGDELHGQYKLLGAKSARYTSSNP